METSKTLKVVGSLVLGLALVCSLLWVLAPDSAAQVDPEDSREAAEPNCETITTTAALPDSDLGDSNDCTRALDPAGAWGGPADMASGQVVR